MSANSFRQRTSSGPRRGPTRIGGARPSQLVVTTGVGAVADLPAMSVVVRGLDVWPPEQQDVIDEPRLLAEVRRVLGPQVRSLKSAPWDPDADSDPWTSTGVPVAPFPRWVRCPACFRLGALDGTDFALVHRFGRRPDLAKFVHATCPKQGGRRDHNRRACIPARFVVVCEKHGHLDDFPYVEFVHLGAERACTGPQLRLADAASTISPRVTITCITCDRSRSITEAAGQDGWQALPRCRGRHPHLQQFHGCGQPLRLMVLGASNLWFSVTASALHLPTAETMGDLVRAHWEIVGAQPNPVVLKAIIDQIDALRGLRGVPIEDVWAQVETLRAGEGGAADDAPADLLDAEWALLSRPTTDRQDEDFRAVPTAVPARYTELLDQVVQVSRLREVQALIGFTRTSSPERRELEPRGRIRLAREPETWVPAVQQRGEGIFLELHEPAVAGWASSVEDHPRVEALRQAYSRWRRNRDLPGDPDFPIARYLLLHTLSHLLIRQVSLECGYSSASIKERLYVGRPGATAAGVLLSTAASDSEGTLGGLVALGRAEHLGRLLDRAFEDADRCSSDPLCAADLPSGTSEALHGAACHACLFASETTCENNNRWLDRAVLVDLPSDGVLFPR